MRQPTIEKPFDAARIEELFRRAEAIPGPAWERTTAFSWADLMELKRMALASLTYQAPLAEGDALTYADLDEAIRGCIGSILSPYAANLIRARAKEVAAERLAGPEGGK